MFFKTDYRKEISASLEAQNFENAKKFIEKAFSDKNSDEDLLAWCAGISYEYRIPNTAQFIPLFVEKFPESLHLMRIFFAKILIDEGNFDAGSNEARIHLRKLLDSGLPESQPESPFVTQAIGFGFLLLTAVYTELGARSYSERVLRHAMPWLKNAWPEAYQNEIARLHQELEMVENKKLDQKWEEFFKTAFQNLDELIALCRKKKCEAIAIRLGLLEGKLRFDPTGQFKIDDQEILMIIIGKKDAYGLL